MFTKNIKDTFTKGLLDAVSGVLGEAKKKCSEGCECEACENERNEMEEAKEGYIPTQRNLTARDNETIGKLAALMKKEREAKEKKEPLGVKTEEVEELDEKRGLWDNIHAKRERIKRGSGERMRKPGSEGAPTAADFKASQKEEVQIDELSDATLKSYSRKALDQSKTLTGDQKVKRQVGARNAIDRLGNNTLAKEEAEQVAEVAPPGAKYERMVKHIKKAYAKDGKLTDKEKSIAYATAWKAKNEETILEGGWEDEDDRDLANHHAYQSFKHDELSKKYAEQGDKKKAAHHKSQAAKHLELHHMYSESVDPGLENELMSQRQGESGKKWRVERAGKTISTHKSKDEADVKAMKHPLNKVKANEEVEQIDEWDISKMPHDKLKFHSTVPHGRYTAKEIKDEIKRRKKVGEYKTEEVNIDEAFEQLDELSKEALGSYVVNAAKDMAQHGITAGLKIGGQENSKKNFKKMANREKGIDTAVTRLTKEEQDFIDALNADTLDEARGRPRKAGAKDFTIHPKTKEKLMHSNPEHMARIEKLQKTGVLQKPKTEANQHIIQQLQRAKTSMRGGETIHFTHGDSTHVAGHHAAKLLDKYAGMKPNEKEAFQKKIGHSHANLKSEL